MINKFFKTIHNKYSKFFRFVFLIRYLIAIFLIFTSLVLIIPKFFNYEKRSEIIKNHLLQTYGFIIEEHEKIEFNFFPFPNLNFQNSSLVFKNKTLKVETQNLKIFPKFSSIYDYKNFKINKVLFVKSKINLDINDLKFFKKIFFNQENSFYFNDLILNIIDKNKSVLKLDNIQFSNFGQKENLIFGKVFGKKFKIDTNKNLNNINFKIINSGINAKLEITSVNDPKLMKGVFRLKILNTNLRFNFDYDQKKINIYNSFFRGKNISFNNKGSIVFKPYLKFDTKFNIEEFNHKVFRQLDLDKILSSKDLLKKINSKNEIIYKSKKFDRYIIDGIVLKIDFAYGRANYFKDFSILKNPAQCKGDVNFLEEYPILSFNCNLSLSYNKKLFKKFSIKIQNKDKPLDLKFNGNLNILNKKINFTRISLNKAYEASNEDLKYFKNTFEEILLDDSFFEIFNQRKIKKFISEIS